MFKCKNCRYWHGDNFENTIMKTCHVIEYLITKLQAEGYKIYLTNALTGPEDDCQLIEANK